MKQAVDYKERRATEIKNMFSSVAPHYDLLNHILSFGLDIRWRRRVASETSKVACQKILDVCSGTGDMAIELCRHWKEKVHIDALDFSHELIKIGQGKIKKARLNGKIAFCESNAEMLPYKDKQFDAITITFGLRNISNRVQALKEFYRVAKPGGLFICLEFSQPANKIFSKLYSFYLLRLVPLLAVSLGSDPDAYRYLGLTIKDFPSPQELAHFMQSTGWQDVTYFSLASGIVTIHQGRK